MTARTITHIGYFFFALFTFQGIQSVVSLPPTQREVMEVIGWWMMIGFVGLTFSICLAVLRRRLVKEDELVTRFPRKSASH